MDYIETLFDKINAIGAVIITILGYIFGDHWALFIGYLCLNVADCICGVMAARLSGTVSSEKGAQGIIKKFGYWIIICLAFGMSAIMIDMGSIINVDMHFSVIIGWLVLAALIVNEIRSIIENLVLAGYEVPKILTGGLAIATKKVDDVVDRVLNEADKGKDDQVDGAKEEDNKTDDELEESEKGVLV